MAAPTSGRLSAWVALTHPRTGRRQAQLPLLALAAMVGALIGLALYAADSVSWSGAVLSRATVTQAGPDGIRAATPQGPVSLHLPALPPVGTVIAVEARPDGRARPVSYRPSPASSVRSGVLLLLGLTLLLQLYRYTVTRRAPSP